MPPLGIVPDTCIPVLGWLVGLDSVDVSGGGTEVVESGIGGVLFPAVEVTLVGAAAGVEDLLEVCVLL